MSSAYVRAGCGDVVGIKKQIGEYLGLPPGEKLCMLRRVKENMEDLPPLDEFYESDSSS